MAVRQSILALYGAVSDGLDEINDPGPELLPGAVERIRAVTAALLGPIGITGSAGERGWYGELLRYFGSLSDQPIPEPSLADVHDDLSSLSEDGTPLAPSWAARAIEVAVVLDTMAQYGVSGAVGQDSFLEAVLTVTPTPVQGLEGGTIFGSSAADDLAQAILDAEIVDRAELTELLSEAGISSAVASNIPKAQLRKVKAEYCCVVTTDSTWDDIPYAALPKVVNPQNWHLFYDEFFCLMTYTGNSPAGWAQIREEVSGDCSRYRLRTALKFWSAGSGNNRLFINYDLDEYADPNADPSPTDPLVLVDNGYIWITNVNGIARVRTSKQLLISGMSATAMTNMAVTLGWATNASDMFHEAARGIPNPLPFQPSVPGVTPAPDTSITWPVKVPRMPADLRAEMVRDGADLTTRGLNLGNQWVTAFASRWADGVNATEVDEMIDLIGDDVKTLSHETFDKVTENFRPHRPPVTP
jgi:hypothetical protein